MQTPDHGAPTVFPVFADLSVSQVTSGDSAAAGDAILVGAGTYLQNINFLGRGYCRAALVSSRSGFVGYCSNATLEHGLHVGCRAGLGDKDVPN
jgi:hypothetical protein